ncbi:MAG: glycosyl hydrolase family 32 [Lentisphaerae bacterium]|jgi:hypothetical protein|nr:glycosyl hydrolase family 32 [Lentisphaerota bacterium]MBT4822101.1 glycosyl hydrolase family 32 [Lentisphaerota bacterium]MBT5604852.1 glycosyl hydrolase family 32 [Lentisphaerota bacterium]MBT7054229.1 glycosyl hydrolase family 32 [Lentisphaerota bacterium]MBT7841026.1 glycosyl hydrolase family 32 [Lentisphaerota bacterium]
MTRNRCSCSRVTGRALCGLVVLVGLLPAVGGERNDRKGKVAMDGMTVTYNGIRLPEQWPPLPDALPLEPSRPPYLVKPPAVIPIDVGRQLLIDGFLIEDTNLKRTFHRPVFHPDCPVLKADRPWEHIADGKKQGAFAMPFSGGVWYDPQDQLFKIWYHGDYGKRYLCHARSRDGVRWDKPDLGVVPGTNIVLESAGGARVVWLDQEDPDPDRRFKLITSRGGDDLLKPGQEWFGSRCSMTVHTSPDGIHWGEAVVRTGPTGDRNSAFWNPFRRRWVFSIREYSPVGGSTGPKRCRRYWESPDLLQNLPWAYREPPLWVGADRDDLLPGFRIQPELYNLDAVAYESVMLGFFCIMREFPDREGFRPKINEVCVGFSRDGFHWHRPDRRSFMGTVDKENAWNRGNMQSVGGGCAVVGDRLYFYVSGRAGSKPHFHDAGGSTGLAVLRRDGFASMGAGSEPGVLTTRPVTFSGRYLFINVDADGGDVRAEVLSETGDVFPALSLAHCEPMTEDSVLHRVQWDDGADLLSIAGQPVRFRFHLRQAHLYAFWTSPDESGASHGYIAAGGPGFTGPTDTVGQAALQAGLTLEAGDGGIR